MSDRCRRRVLYGLTGGAWLGVAHAMFLSTERPEDLSLRPWLILAIAVASCLFTASLFVIFTRPQDQAYRAGVRDGQRTSGCTAFRPALTVLDNDSGSATARVLRLPTGNS